MKPFELRLNINLEALKSEVIFPSPKASPRRQFELPAELIKSDSETTKKFGNQLNQFACSIGEYIFASTREAFFDAARNEKMSKSATKLAWQNVAQSAAMFAITSEFTLYEMIKNSLEESANRLTFLIHISDQGVVCLAVDNGSGFVKGNFAKIINARRSQDELAWVDYGKDILGENEKLASSKKTGDGKLKTINEEDDLPSPHGVRELPPELGGAGLGLAHTLKAMKPGDGKLHLTNTAHLESLQFDMSAFPENHGAAVIFTSPLFNRKKTESWLRAQLHKINPELHIRSGNSLFKIADTQFAAKEMAEKRYTAHLKNTDSTSNPPGKWHQLTKEQVLTDNADEFALCGGAPATEIHPSAGLSPALYHTPRESLLEEKNEITTTKTDKPQKSSQSLTQKISSLFSGEKQTTPTNITLNIKEEKHDDDEEEIILQKPPGKKN